MDTAQNKEKKKQSGILSNSLCVCDENREGRREKKQRVFIRDRTEHSGILSNISRACNYPTKIIRQIYRERERERERFASSSPSHAASYRSIFILKMALY